VKEQESLQEKVLPPYFIRKILVVPDTEFLTKHLLILMVDTFIVGRLLTGEFLDNTS
jgi:hypothetical protein